MKAQLPSTSAADNCLAILNNGPLERVAFWKRVHGIRDTIQKHSAQRWALICEDSSWFTAGLIALADCKRVLVLPQSNLAATLSASVEFDAVLSDCAGNYSNFDCLSVLGLDAKTADEPHLPDDEVRIEFQTSGSTGQPKCVPKAFAQLRNEVHTLEKQWGKSFAHAITIGTVPHHHLYGLLFRILWPLLTGRPFFTNLCLHPSALRTALPRVQKVIVSSPAFLSRIDDFSDLPPADEIAAVFSSGAPLPDSTARKFIDDLGRPIIEIYGSTETGGIAWRSGAMPKKQRRWQAFPGVQLELREEPAGKRLWVRSPCTWQAEWMASGDLADLDPDGGLELHGRADDVVKIADKRISLEEIRSHLATHALVSDARLVLIPGTRPLIGAVVILKPAGKNMLAAHGKKAVCEKMRAWLRNRYEPIMIPKKWRFIDTFPDTNMGKIEKLRMQQLFRQ